MSLLKEQVCSPAVEQERVLLRLAGQEAVVSQQVSSA